MLLRRSRSVGGVRSRAVEFSVLPISKSQIVYDELDSNFIVTGKWSTQWLVNIDSEN